VAQKLNGFIARLRLSPKFPEAEQEPHPLPVLCHLLIMTHTLFIGVIRNPKYEGEAKDCKEGKT